MCPPLLVATDVDGTLLDPDERVPPRTVAVIGRLVAAGAVFVLVTGRAPRWLQPVVRQLGVARLALCANGSVLYDAVDDRMLAVRTLDPPVLLWLAAAATECLPGCVLAVERVGPDALTGPFVAEAGYRRARDDRADVTVSRREVVSSPAVKLLVRHRAMPSEAMLAALAPVVGDVAEVTFARPHGLVEISPPGVTKASGLAEVARRSGVPASDVVAFGDMPNDMEMMRWAGHGVAMGNAHPMLLEVADEVTTSNFEDGVSLVLERWF